MNDKLTEQFFALLRRGLGGDGELQEGLTTADWQRLHTMAAEQSLLGVVYRAVEQLPEDQRPPREVLMQWFVEYERIAGLNKLLTNEAARLTRLFAEKGRQTAILKGQANARLYPDPLSRQPGDIDIWVEGGRKSVIALLKQMGLMEKTPAGQRPEISYHHVHLPVTRQGVIVEVHFRPSSGNSNPVTNHRLQRFLCAEALKSEPCPEGFNVPTMKFALAMQLAHIQHHYLSVGVGLRQLCDYYLLLQNATEEDRKCLSSMLKPLGLKQIARAVMWLLHEVLHLDEELMLCQPEEHRGQILLQKVLCGGNFGRYAPPSKGGYFTRILKGRLRRWKQLPHYPGEVVGDTFRFWIYIAKTIPERIRLRSISLTKAKEKGRK